jgi:hypothetical protein
VRAHKIDTKPAGWIVVRSDRGMTVPICAKCFEDWSTWLRVLVAYEQRRQLT